MLHDLLGVLQEKERRIEKLQHQLQQALRQRFGKKSESIDPGQLRLFLAEIQATLQALPDPPVPSEAPPAERPRNGHGRAPLPAHLPRKRQEYPLPEAEQICRGCHGRLERIGEEVTRQLDYVPASFFVREHVRVKYACRKCQENVVVSEMPPQPIEKGLPGPGLLAHVVTSKYADHLPLYRLEGIFERHGIDLSRQTLCDWMGRSAEVVEPVYEAMKADLFRSKVLHTDDTPVPVLDPTRDRTRLGRLWVHVGDRDHPQIVFDYTPTRSRDGPVAFLGGYRGYLQADAYAGYDGIFTRGGAIEVGCMAHARRKFFDAEGTDPARARVALAFIQQLYAVEREAKDLPSEARQALRQARSRPILDAFRTWLEAQQPAVLPKSPLGEAFGYAFGQWEALRRYLEDGDLDIDNNEAERALRCVAIGRKNWLFAGSDEGGWRAAILFSLVATCKRHGIDPFVYLRDVLARIATHPARAVADLMPSNWKPREEAARGHGSPESSAPLDQAVATG